MSSELKLKLVFDSTDAERAAESLPDAIERSNRKKNLNPASREAQDVKGTSGQYKKMASTGKAIEDEQQRAAEAQQAAREKEEKETEDWNRKELSRKLKELNRQAREQQAQQQRQQVQQQRQQAQQQRQQAQQQAQQQRQQVQQQRQQAQQQAQQQRQQAQQQAQQQRQQAQQQRQQAQQQARQQAQQQRQQAQQQRQQAQQQAQQQAASAGAWVDKFGDALETVMMRSLGPVAAASKVIELGWGSVIDRIKVLYSIGEAKIESGIQFTSTRGLEMFGKAGTLESEDAIAMAKIAQTQANALATAGSGANAYGFQYFGMTDYQRYRQEGVDMVELIIAMAKRYKEEGGTEAYRQAAESVVGSDWRKLSALLYMQANPDKAKQALVGYAPGTWKGSAMDTIEQAGGYLQQRAMAQTLKFAAMQAMQGELMGGTKGAPNQILSTVTSLQAMGGGDILSAIARGPQDQIAQNTAQALPLLQQIANQGGTNSPPARLGP